jgi:hypothetical protein
MQASSQDVPPSLGRGCDRGCRAVPWPLPQLDAAALQRCLEQEEGEEDSGAAAAPPLLALYAKDGPRGWAAAAGSGRRFSCPWGGIKELVVQYTLERRHRRLADFEDHLADISK